MIGLDKALCSLLTRSVEGAGLGVDVDGAGENKTMGTCKAGRLQDMHITQDIDACGGEWIVVCFINIGDGCEVVDHARPTSRLYHLV